MLQFKEQLKCRASWSLPCCALSSLPTLSLVIPCVPSFRMDGICKYSIFALLSKQLSGDVFICVGPDIENCYFLAQQWHRITEKLSLEEISGDFLVQPLCSTQGLLEPAAEDHVHSCFEYLQGWRFHNLYEKCAPLFNHLHTQNECFSYISVEFLVVQFVPIDSWPVTGCY